VRDVLRRAIATVRPTLVVAALASCAATPLGRNVPHAVDKLALTPFASTETCVDLAAGDRLDYRYEASEPVHFDIRYREGGAVVAPILRERSRHDSGIFEARLRQRYCLEWEAGAAGATLDYVIEIRGPAAS
jgi:hypothetical protein